MTHPRIFSLILIGIIGFGLLADLRPQQILVQHQNSLGLPFLKELASQSSFKGFSSSLTRSNSTRDVVPPILKPIKHSYTPVNASSGQGLKGNFAAHAPITIQNNADFLTQASTEGWNGTGTAADPIVITGYSITSLVSTLLDITSTTLYFEVRNNVFNGVNRTYDAIHLEKVTQGVIVNNTVHYSKNAINLDMTSGEKEAYTTIANNTIESNQVGIYLWNSDHNAILGNRLIDNLEAGIHLVSSRDNSIKDNVLVNNGLSIDSWNDYLQREVSNNTVNGRPLVYWQNVNGGTIPDGAGQVVLVNCNTVTISNQVLTNSSVGIHAVSCSNLNISNNILANNSIYGIKQIDSSAVITNNTFLNNEYAGIRVVWYSEGTIANNVLRNNYVGISVNKPSFLTISNNSFINNYAGITGIKVYFGHTLDITNNMIASNNWGINLAITNRAVIGKNTIANNTVYGIEIQGSNNLIWGNTLTENMQYGISLDNYSEGNRILWNTFINNNANNSSQAYDGGNTNTFSYNYWSEWVSPDINNDDIVDTPYLIEGEAFNKDFYPVASRYFLSMPKILYPKENEILYDNVILQWTALDNSLVHQVNYTLYYSHNDQFWTMLATDLATANYLWDTHQVPNDNYSLKVVAICPGPLMIESPAKSFTIQNNVFFNQFFITAFVFGLYIGAVSGLTVLMVIATYLIYLKKSNKRKICR